MLEELAERCAEALAGGAGAGAVAGKPVQRRQPRLAERIAHRPRHHLREVHDHHPHAEFDFARALQRLLGALRRDARRSIGSVTERRHDAENQQRHQQSRSA